MRHRIALILLTLVTLLQAACIEPTGVDSGATIRPQLMRLEGDAQSAPPLGVGAASAAVQGDYPWSSDIEITAFETPVRAIWLQGTATRALIYDCAADSNDGCLVDLAGPALQDLLGAGAVEIGPGTYDEVVVSTCEGEGSYTAYLTGSVSLDGQVWVSKTDGVLSIEGAAEPVATEFSGCGRTYPVPDPVVVADTLGEAVSFRLYFDIRDIAWASLGAQGTQGGWLPGGCAGAQPGGVNDVPYLCVAYPDMAGVVDDRTPEIERYRINDGATLGLIFHATSGDFIGGFTRRYFQEDQHAQPGFTADTPVEGFVVNGDETFRVYTFGSSSNGGDPVGHYLDIAAFRRANHSGTALDLNGNQFAYEAVRIE